MRYLKYMVFSLIAVLALAACGDDNDGPEPIRSAEKTILFYMPWTASESSASGSLYSYFLSNLSDVETAIRESGGLKQNRVLVFISPSATNSVLLEIKYANNACSRDTLRTYADIDYTTPSGIARVLNDVKILSPAGKYDMIIGSHGNGWIPRGTDNYYKTRAFGGSDYKYQTNVSDLAAGIQQAGMHMQFVCFDDCYMAGVEVAYDLKDATDYLIASTSEVMADGIPYREVFKYMTSANPDYANICQAFYDHYSTSAYPYGTLSVINCMEIDLMANVMKQLNASYTFDDSQIGNIQKLDGFGQTTYFDLEDYVKTLCGGAVPGDFSTALYLLVACSCHTNRIYTSLNNYNGGFSFVDINAFSGITISDPTTNTYVVDYKAQTAWWKATH